MTNSHADQVQFEAERVRIPRVPSPSCDPVAITHPMGAIAVPRRSARGLTYFGFVRQVRHASLNETLEFPHGGTHQPGESPLEAAARALSEETGLHIAAERGIDLGPIWADTGILRSDVPAALFTITGLAGVPRPDDAEGDIRLRWLSVGEVIGAIATNRIVCAMTLSAWAKVTARRLDIVP